MSQSDFTAAEPNISAITVSDPTPTIGDTISITATITNETSVFLRYRTVLGDVAFEKVSMFDDGMHNDGAANDNIYGADVIVTGGFIEYYIYAENNTIGKFSPTNAEHEFYNITAQAKALGSLVINEFMASNNTAVADQDGDFDDWIEIYNNGNVAIDIDNYKLTDDANDYTQFSFPSGTTINPNEYIVVWADGDLTQAGYHADFKLSSNGETILLTDSNLVIVDSISYSSQISDTSYGRLPNGTGSFVKMPQTLGAQNSLTGTVSYKISINEFLAINTNTQADQDGEFDSWIEIYNYDTMAISLDGFKLSDDKNNLSAFTFPTGTILNADDYLIVWADKDLSQSGFHGDFNLSNTSGNIYITDSSLNYVDSVSYSVQIADTSYGRYPNGTGSFRTMPPTYNATNSIVSIVTGDIVINEFLASNDFIKADQDGEYDDWIELYNKGNATIDLSTYSLSDDISMLGAFTFPSGTMLAPDSFIVVWADNDTTQVGYHANFKISASGETLYLSKNGSIEDSIQFGSQTTDVSFGRYPNGTGNFQLMTPTFRAQNITSQVITYDLAINEFMASNATIQADQDGEFDDWIEIYNYGTTAISLDGFKLSDDRNDLSLFSFPNGTTLQADSFIVVWADADLTQTGYHANFKLASAGESIYLANATASLIDSVTYPTQLVDSAYGRYVNGTGAFRTLVPTFRALNRINTGISDLDYNKIQFGIFPNPADESFTIEMIGQKEQEIVSIYNNTGQIIFTDIVNQSLTINSSDWNTGIYFIVLGKQSAKLIIR
jgi:hypothetical protein